MRRSFKLAAESSGETYDGVNKLVTGKTANVEYSGVKTGAALLSDVHVLLICGR